MAIVVIERLCVGCGQCELVCPEKAVAAFGTAVIDGEKCSECLTCLGFCPVIGALEVENE